MMVRRAYDIITFDCYGTLIDWESGISEAFIKAAEADDILLNRGEVLAAYAEIEPVVEGETHSLYRAVLAETARRVAVKLGWHITEARAPFLGNSLANWLPFYDTNDSLECLAAAGYRLGILSNLDDDLLAQTLLHLNVNFDLLITAQQVGSYKPAHGHFLAARNSTGGDRWLHAAQSYFHDIVPARELSIPIAWINRKSSVAPGAARPDYEFRTLSELADWLV